MSTPTSPPAAELSLMRRYAVAWLVAIMVTTIYVSVGRFMEPSARPTASGSIDSWVPFVRWTIWLYLPMYAFVFHVAVFVTRTRRTLYRTILSLFIALALCCAAFVVWPQDAPRVPLEPLDDWTDWLFRVLLAIDPPNNTFPSLHVASLLCVGFGCARDDRRRGAAVIALSLLPIAATLTTKQHYALDLLGGAIVAAISHWAAFEVVGARATRTSTAVGV